MCGSSRRRRRAAGGSGSQPPVAGAWPRILLRAAERRGVLRYSGCTRRQPRRSEPASGCHEARSSVPFPAAVVGLKITAPADRTHPSSSTGGALESPTTLSAVAHVRWSRRLTHAAGLLPPNACRDFLLPKLLHNALPGGESSIHISPRRMTPARPARPSAPSRSSSGSPAGRMISQAVDSYSGAAGGRDSSFYRMCSRCLP